MLEPSSPLRYPGGKNCLLRFVSSLLRENNLIGCKYIEPFAGGAGLALNLMYEEYVERIVINDYDPLVYSFWVTCASETERFIEWIERVNIDLETWDKSKNIVSNFKDYELFDRATSFFFLNRTNVSGVLSGGIIGGRNQNGKYKIDARFNKKSLINRIRKFSRFSSRVEVSNLDGIEVIENFKDYDNRTLIYMDPPYYDKGSNLYLNSYKHEDHTILSDQIDKLKTPWFLSYDNNQSIKSMYGRCNIYSYNLQHSTSNKIGQELLITPKNLKVSSSIYLLKNQIKITPS